MKFICWWPYLLRTRRLLSRRRRLALVWGLLTQQDRSLYCLLLVLLPQGRPWKSRLGFVREQALFSLTKVGHGAVTELGRSLVTVQVTETIVTWNVKGNLWRKSLSLFMYLILTLYIFCCTGHRNNDLSSLACSFLMTMTENILQPTCEQQREEFTMTQVKF